MQWIAHILIMNNYDILGISYTTSLDEVKKAYRKKALKHHPDRGGDPKLFHQIRSAYAELKDELENKSTVNSEYELNWTISDNYFDDIGYDEVQYNKDLAIRVHIPLEICYNGGYIEERYELLSGKFQTVNLKVPIGIKNNQTIQYKGFGDDSIITMPRGTLHVTYIVDIHDSFIRRDNDLYTSVTINAFDAMIGTSCTIKLLDNNNLTIDIPPGTQPNQEFTFNGLGFYSNSNEIGNLIVLILITIPNIINDKDIITLQQLSNSYS